MQKKLRSYDQSNGLIIPFLLTIDRDSHLQCLENKLSMLYQRNQDDLPADLEEFLERKIDEYQ